MESFATDQLSAVWQSLQLILNSLPCGDWACTHTTASIKNPHTIPLKRLIRYILNDAKKQLTPQDFFLRKCGK
jgi:hypothetical protein